MKNGIVTYVYPGSEKYFSDFIASVNKALLDDTFQIVVFCDGLENAKELLNDLQINFQVIDNKGSINKTRYNSFVILNGFNLDNIFFQDIDDTFSNNRFKVLENKLEKYKLVSNDLKVIRNSVLAEKGLWGKRLRNKFEFDHTFLLEYNIVGLGNTAIKASLIKDLTIFDEKPIAYDWFFFYQIMKEKNITGLFTNECYTFYNQHEENTAGVREEITEERMKFIIEVKKRHYESLIRAGFNELEPYYNKIQELIPSSIQENCNFFWWEETLKLQN